MTDTLVVDEAVLAMLVRNEEAKKIYPILNLQRASSDPTGCPRCPHRRARRFTDLKAIKMQLATMTPVQAQEMKRILGAKTLVFKLLGPKGIQEIRI